MKIKVLRPALREFLEASEFYEIQQSGVGLRFQKEIWRAIQHIRDYPFAWPAESKDIRRCFVHKFPYKILYYVHKDTVVILAFAHLHRRPNYWVDRRK